MILKANHIYWFADTTVHIDPSPETMAKIAIQTAEMAKNFSGQEPRVAMLSFSNFGSNRDPRAQKVARATELVKAMSPSLIVDGEMQADVALNPSISEEAFPFNAVPGNANVLVFPDLQAGNIAYKLMDRMGGADVIGPILIGPKKPMFVLQRGSEVGDIVNMASIAAMDVQIRKKK